MTNETRRFVFTKSRVLEAQVDIVMRHFGYASYSEMFRCLVRDAYRYVVQENRKPADPQGATDVDSLVVTPTGVVVTQSELAEVTPMLRRAKIVAGPGQSHDSNDSLDHSSPEWKQLRRQVLSRDRNRCQSCRIHRSYGRKLTAHHIVPRDQGGNDDLSNLITLCEPCHNTIEGQGLTEWQIKQGVTVQKS